MQHFLDPIVLFIASNAIFIAIGAAFSNISNEIFSFDKENNIEVKKYNSSEAIKVRNNIIKYITASLFVYILNLICIFFIYFFKYIIAYNYINSFEKLNIFIFTISISWLVIHIILLFIAYFKIRNAHFEDKAAKSSPKND